MEKKATILTYGCQMNINESAKIKQLLENMGYEIIEDIYHSDVVILNTCTIREGAATKIYGKLGELKTIKTTHDHMIIIVTGCLAQEAKETLFKKAPHVNAVLGNQNIAKIPDVLEKIENNILHQMLLVDDEDELPPRIDANFGDDIVASIAITYGCNNYCTFCIVPHVRGMERSVPMIEVLNDVSQYVTKGYKEILFLGQNVNSYGTDRTHVNETFARLLEESAKISGDFWIKYVSPHPKDFTEDVIDVIAKNTKISRMLHLPLQSGSTKILKAMNRGYTKEEFITLALHIKEKVPNIALTTDIIVGFPGETEQDFQDTLDVIQTVGFENAFMFMYSPRSGTIAATMEEQIPEDVKSERLRILMDAQNEKAKIESQKYVGHVEKVLVEGPSRKNPDMFSGRTSSHKIVLFKGKKEQIGQFVSVKITEGKTWTLYGEIV